MTNDDATHEQPVENDASKTGSNAQQPMRKSTSKYYGVSRYSPNRFRTIVKVNNKYVHVGIYDTPEEAAHVADTWNRKIYGKKALLNFPRNGEEEQSEIIVPGKRRRRRRTKAEIEQARNVEAAPTPPAKPSEPKFSIECVDGLQQLARVRQLLGSMTSQQRELLANIGLGDWSKSE